MLKIGITGQAQKRVTEEMTAQHMGSGELPVLATPCMISMIEEAAWKSVAPELEPGQGTVGTAMNVQHVSATPVGMLVHCETKLTQIDRRRLVFDVKAYDERGLIGEGTHERFIITNEKFLAKANAKRQSE